MIGIEESMYDDRLSIRQNLIDAGCDEEFVAKFMSLSEGQKSEMLTMLAAYRRSLLDNIHEDERKVYRLDYLVNKLKLDWETSLVDVTVEGLCVTRGKSEVTTYSTLYEGIKEVIFDEYRTTRYNHLVVLFWGGDEI